MKTTNNTMKASPFYNQVAQLEIFTPFVNRLAEISAFSTLKFLEQKETELHYDSDTTLNVSTNRLMSQLRTNCIKDKKYLERVEHIKADWRTEYKRDCLREQLRLNNREKAIIKRMFKKEQDMRQAEILNDRLFEILCENEYLKEDIAKITAYLDMVRPILEDTLSDNGYDCINVACRAILFILHRSANADKILSCIASESDAYRDAKTVDERALILDTVSDSIKNIIVAKREYKTKKGGYRYYTLKGYADQMVRKYINGMRSGTASRTNFLITGYDEYGQELYIQADRLTTAGGITDIFRKEEFEEFQALLNLTPMQKNICRKLMEGETQTDIAKTYGVSQQAIAKRIAKIQAQAKNISEVQAMRRHHDSAK